MKASESHALTKDQLWEILRNDEDSDLWLLDCDVESMTYATRIVPVGDDADLAAYMDPSTWPRFICKSLAVTLLVRAHGIEGALESVNALIAKTIARPTPRNPLSSLGAFAGRAFVKRMGA